MGGENDKFVG